MCGFGLSGPHRARLRPADMNPDGCQHHRMHLRVKPGQVNDRRRKHALGLRGDMLHTSDRLVLLQRGRVFDQGLDEQGPAHMRGCSGVQLDGVVARGSGRQQHRGHLPEVAAHEEVQEVPVDCGLVGFVTCRRRVHNANFRHKHVDQAVPLGRPDELVDEAYGGAFDEPGHRLLDVG